MENFFLLIFAISTIVCRAGGQSLNDTTTLMTDMLTDYDKRQRPIYNQTLPIQVNVSLDLVSLKELNEIEEKFSAVILLHLHWKDEKITWDPALYGNTTSLVFKLADVWYPPLVLGNPFDKVEEVATKTINWCTVRFDYTGEATFQPGGAFASSCSIDVRNYPMDTQKCGFRFMTWGYNANEIQLISTRMEILQTFYPGHGEWALAMSMTSVDENNYFNADIMMMRKPLFLVVSVLLPVVFMTLLNNFAFLLPAESGERVGFSITVLLAIAVFLTMVSESLPRSAQTMAVMCYYLMSVLIVSIVICVSVILNLKVYFADERRVVPSWCKTLVRICGCSCFSKTDGSSQKETAIYPFNSKNNEDEKMDTKPKLGEMQDEDQNKEITWRHVSFAVDRFCFIFFTLTAIILTLSFVGELIKNM